VSDFAKCVHCGSEEANCNGVSLAELGDCPLLHSQGSDVNLIAAAPDLLQACEDCMEDRGDWGAKMFAAIQKAKGELT
jgi:hypothetical protein